MVSNPRVNKAKTLPLGMHQTFDITFLAERGSALQGFLYKKFKTIRWAMIESS